MCQLLTCTSPIWTLAGPNQMILDFFIHQSQYRKTASISRNRVHSFVSKLCWCKAQWYMPSLSQITLWLRLLSKDFSMSCRCSQNFKFLCSCRPSKRCTLELFCTLFPKLMVRLGLLSLPYWAVVSSMTCVLSKFTYKVEDRGSVRISNSDLTKDSLALIPGKGKSP